MKNREILPFLKEIKQQDMTHFGDVYAVFERLLSCFCFRLHDDDAMQELTLFLLELIYSLDTEKFIADDSEAIKRYIAVSLRNKYIALSKQNTVYRTMSNELCNDFAGESLHEEHISLQHALRQLPDKQRMVIISRYYYGYTIEEIADRLCISRQAVNQLKNRGLLALRKHVSF